MSVFERDFDSLAVGDRFTTPVREVSAADIEAFAALTGDSHPQHTDASWAEESRFGERIAHGLLVLSFASGLMPFDPERVVALRSVREAVFKAPVKIGDEVHVAGSVSALREIDDSTGLVECRWRVLNQEGRLVVRALVELVWRRVLVPEPVLI
jgi:3-hydroxybutyryl-CoA dehydratase